MPFLPELLIFDCDGVLVDTETTAARLFVEMVCELGLVMTEEQRAEVGGLPTPFYLKVELVEGKYGYELPADFRLHYDMRLWSLFEAGVSPIPGVVQALDRVTARTCVASGNSLECMRLTLGKAGLLGRLDGRLFSSEQVARGKPHPDVFLFAAQQMRVNPSHCVVVEDSCVGVHAGIAAGMKVFGYAGLTDGSVLAEAGALPFFNMAELPDLFKRIQS